MELGGGRSIVVVFYDAGLSSAVSFEPEATADADRFARERVAPRLGGSSEASSGSPLVVIATDGELYGHHQAFREPFLQRLIRPGADQPDHGFDVVDLASALAPDPSALFRTVRINERTSWSCHHGVLRWSGECGMRDRRPLEGAAARGIRTARGGDRRSHGGAVRRVAGEPDPWAARDAYIDVVLGAEPSGSFAAHWVGSKAPIEARHTVLRLMEAQRWRLAMFSSDGWFWDDPMRPETRRSCASRPARSAGWRTRSQARTWSGVLIEDLTLLRSPRSGMDGAAIYGWRSRTTGSHRPLRQARSSRRRPD